MGDSEKSLAIAAHQAGQISARRCHATEHQRHRLRRVHGVDSMRPIVVCIRRVNLVVVCIPQGARCLLPMDASVPPDGFIRCTQQMHPSNDAERRLKSQISIL